MRSAVKIALGVTEGQSTILDGQSKIANWLYNRLLETANGLRQRYRESQNKQVGKTLYNERGLRDLIPELKAQYPFLKTVYSSVLKNAALRLSKAIRDYQDGKHGQRAKAVKWPKFRAWKRQWFSLQYDEPYKGYMFSGRTLTLSLGKDAQASNYNWCLSWRKRFLPGWLTSTSGSVGL